MMRKLIGAAVVMAAFAVPASANPAAGIVAGGQPQTDAAITPVHGRAHGCMIGPRGLWHWSDRWGRVHACGISPGDGWIWHYQGGRRGWWHPQHRRWHGR